MKMHVTLFAILLVALALGHVQAQGNPVYTGQPGCLTEEEIAVGVYRHFRNKRAYWVCSVLGEPSSLQLCPIGEGFLEAVRACVPWLEWYWTPTVSPPSSPVVTIAPAEGSND